MKIKDVRSTVVTVPFNKTRLWALGCQKGTTRTIVEIATDEGIIGVGETIGVTNDTIDRRIKPLLLGEDPTNILRLTEKAKWATPWGAVNTPGSVPVAAIEMALWDIKGKATSRPVCDLLGGKFRDRLKFINVIQYAVASEEEFSEQNAVDAILREIDETTRKYGSDIIQLYVAVFSPQKDIEIVRGIREKFGSNLRIGIDVNRTWSPETAIRTLNALQSCSLDYVEDATAEIGALGRVRSSVSVPFSTHYNNVYEIAKTRAADIIAGDIHECGGFLGTKKLISQCEGLNLGFWFHSSNELGISLTAMLHCIASSPHIVHPSQTIAGWLTDDIITKPHKFRNGMIELPDGPGLGIDIDYQKLEKYAAVFKERGEMSPHDLDSRRAGWFPQLSGI